MRSKSSNLEEWKIWGVDVEMGLYLWRYNFFGEGSVLMKCSILYRGLRGSTQFFWVCVWGGVVISC